jgi:hypothetical protein
LTCEYHLERRFKIKRREFIGTLAGAGATLAASRLFAGPSNLDQMERAKELINKVGRPIVSGAEAIKYLDIPFAVTRPKA